MAIKRWVVGKPDRERAKLMAEECDIDAFAALIACGRGVDDAAELELMLSDEPILCDPNELADIRLAAECVNDAIADNTVVAVFGDYDCDGVVSTAILYDYLKGRGATVIPYIPDRLSEGYGMNNSAIDELASKGVGLIITVDNGISCAEEIKYAKSLGIKTVVTDHHIPPEILPEAEAVVDPHRADCPSVFKEICGAEVAFKLACVLDDKEPEQLLPRYADMLAVAVVGDVMPLTNENRSIVKEGIKKIRKNPSAGIAAILNIAGIDRKSVNAGKISFGIVPRINAAGRMGSAKRAFELLTSTDTFAALRFAGPIDDDNARRQHIERDISAEAIKMIEQNGFEHNRVIVVCGEDWHMGVLGIVASRICERYGKPAIVLSNENGVAHGSGRSFSGFHLYNSIHHCEDLLLKHGGHELAAGLSLSADNICAFREKINQYAAMSSYSVPEIHLDFCLNPVGMSVDMAFAISSLEPFGQGNPAPLFGIFGVRLEKITPVSGGKHLKLLCSKSGGAFQAILFGVTPQQFCFEIGDEIDLAVTLDTNFYRDEYTLSVQIKALRLSGIDEDALFESKMYYENFMSGIDTDVSAILPDRAQVGEVYKFISRVPVNIDRVKYMFMNELGYAKTQIALTTLRELGLVLLSGDVLSAQTVASKTDLMNSKTYKTLCERGEKE